MPTTTTTANPRRFPKFTLIGGVGNYTEGQACVMSAAVAKWRFKQGVPLNGATDQLECVCPVIRKLAIAINAKGWWKDDAERTKVLLPLVDKILDTKGKVALTRRRAFRCADVAVREFAADALDACGKKDWGTKLRECAPIIDKKTARLAETVARDARKAAAAAAYADAKTKMRNRCIVLLKELCAMKD